MNILFIFLFMMFMHIVADYNLQGCLADLKQKSFWTNHPNYLWFNSNDYKMALFCHSFAWAFCIMMPIAIACGFSVGLCFVVVFAFNTLIHALIDDAKANQNSINLIQDQCIHFLQIVVTCWLFSIGVL